MLHPSVRKILESPVIAQRTPEWYYYRSKRVTASECSIVIARGKGSKSLMHRKKFGGASNFSNEYTRIGSENEEEIVKQYREMYPEVEVYHDLSIIPHPTENYVAASLDACTNTGINVEIKTCFKDKKIPICKAYRDQVQLQMEVADLELTHLVQQYYNLPGRPLVITEIKRDREWFAKNAPIFKEFISNLESFSPFDLFLIKCQIAKMNQDTTDIRMRIEDYYFEQDEIIDDCSDCSIDMYYVFVQMHNTIC